MAAAKQQVRLPVLLLIRKVSRTRLIVLFCCFRRTLLPNSSPILPRPKSKNALTRKLSSSSKASSIRPSRILSRSSRWLLRTRSRVRSFCFPVATVIFVRFFSLTYSVRFLEQLSVRASRSRSLARQFRSRAAWRRISLSSRSVPLLAIFYPPAQS
jgi:hypothetical protein